MDENDKYTINQRAHTHTNFVNFKSCERKAKKEFISSVDFHYGIFLKFFFTWTGKGLKSVSQKFKHYFILVHNYN